MTVHSLRPCRNPTCTTRLPVNPAIWPGDEGYCSAVCREIAAIDDADREIRAAMHRLVTPKEEP